MTLEEAIRTIKAAQAEVEWEYPMEYAAAFDMAISALQGQDSETRRICDTCRHDQPSKKWPCVDCDMREPADRWGAQDVPDINVGDTKTQLSAEDTTNLQPTCNRLATDTIYRWAALDALGEEPEVWTGKDEYAQGLNNQWHYDVNALKALPSAQPEIIHCEECVYRKDNFMGDWCTCWCGWTSLDGHCHKGANKDE